MEHNERSGVLVAVVGFVLLALADSIWKTGLATWAPTALGAMRHTIGAIGLAIALAWREGRGGFRVTMPGIQLLRATGIAVATAAFITSLRFMPLVEVTAISFLSPMLTAFIAALVLREKVGRTEWISIVAGFAGVLIVLRPNIAAFGPIAGLPLLSALGFSMLVIGNRMLAGKASALAMQFQVAAPGAILLWLFAAAGHVSGVPFLALGTPTWMDLAICAAVAVVATCAHWSVYLGTTRSGAATIAPVTYVQMVVASLIGHFAFGEAVDPLTVIGILVIVGSGLYLWRSRPPVAIVDEAL